MSDQVENKIAEPETTDSKSIIITKSIKSLTSPEKTASIDNNQENTEKTPKALTEAEVFCYIISWLKIKMLIFKIK